MEDPAHRNISTRTEANIKSFLTKCYSGFFSNLRIPWSSCVSSIDASTPDDRDQQTLQWMSVMDRHPELAKAYKRSDLLGWHVGNIRDGGPCRFHDHHRDCRRSDLIVDGACPFLDDEMFPSSFAETTRSRKREKRPVVVEITDQGWQEVCSDDRSVAQERDLTVEYPI